MANLNIAVEIAGRDMGASAAIKSVSGSIEHLGQISHSVSGAVSGFLSGTMKGLATFGLAAEGVEALASSARGLGDAMGLGLASELEQTRTQFLAFTKDAALTDQIMADLRKEADSTPFSFRELSKATAGLIPVSKQAKVPLNDLIKTAELLAAVNPEQGLEGAAFALREAMSGDFVSIIDRFNLPRQRLNELKEQGVPALEAIKTAMAEMGIDASLVAGMAGTAAGKWSTFKDTIDGVRLAFATPIFDALKLGLDELQTALGGNLDVLKSFAAEIGAGLGQVLRGLIRSIPMVVNGIKTFLGALAGTWQAAEGIDQVSMALGRVGTVINRVANWLLPLMGRIGDAVGRGMAAFKGLSASISGVSPQLGSLQQTVQNLAAPFREFGGIVQRALSGDVAGAVKQFVGSLITSRLELIETLAGWGRAFVEWVGPMVPPLLAELGRTVDELLGFVLKQVPEIGKRIDGWGKAFREWIEPMIPPMLKELEKMAKEIGAWIQRSAPPLLQAFITEWVPSATNWLLTAATDLVRDLGPFLNKLLDWVEKEAPGIGQKFITQWVPTLVGWVGDAAVKIAPKLGEFLFEVGKWVATEGVPRLTRISVALGEGLVKGIVEGIGNLAKWLWDQIGRLAQGAVDAAVGKITGGITGQQPPGGGGGGSGFDGPPTFTPPPVQSVGGGGARAMRLSALSLPTGGGLTMAGTPAAATSTSVNVTFAAPVVGSMSVRDDADLAAMRSNLEQLPEAISAALAGELDDALRRNQRRPLGLARMTA